MNINKGVGGVYYVSSVLLYYVYGLAETWRLYSVSQHKKASNHYANLPLEMYSFTL